ncbi:MAG: hypothetical protein A2W31_06925 [Planctomycetes bacterium RBG_16_64_10]|nr:MAG: hypothetical protein A2W31_06925 [Planctomycetes bacterium RBG_16_64_10]
MTLHTQDGGRGRAVVAAITAIAALYLLAVLFQLPQRGTAAIVAAASHAEPATEPHPPTHSDTQHAVGGQVASTPGYWMVTPFVLLLGAIAILPLLRSTEHWWDSNLHRFWVAAGLGILTLIYYAVCFGEPMESHWPAHHVVQPSAGWIQWGLCWTVFANAILEEYIPFIALLFSLYVISGGIRIEGDLRANPLTNAAFLGVGSVLASFIGTTGAAMVLIRPLLETNRERRFVQHTVIFFIFAVCNCGGCLLPIGDPPLFLGYLRGVDFTWTLSLWPQWLMVNSLLLVGYILLDRLWFYPHEAAADLRRDVTQVRRLRFQGVGLNGILLAGVVLAVALLAPSKTFPGTDWHPWLYLREVVQLMLVAASLGFGSDPVRRANQFNYHAIVEVAALFSGIFLCMQPALQILAVAGPRLGISTPTAFFWSTGSLSAVLDNAPTYVVFFETAKTVTSSGMDQVAGVAEPLLIAVSLGAVFMGAMTYIGNGPNFMVKAIAEKSGIRMPSFFGYLFCYSAPILLPIFVLLNWWYLH